MLLTPQEQVVLDSVCRGLTTKEVARSLGVSPKTIDAHRVSVYRKLGVHNIAGCVVMAIRLSLFHLPAGPRSGEPCPT